MVVFLYQLLYYHTHPTKTKDKVSARNVIFFSSIYFLNIPVVPVWSSDFNRGGVSKISCTIDSSLACLPYCSSIFPVSDAADDLFARFVSFNICTDVPAEFGTGVELLDDVTKYFVLVFPTSVCLATK